MPTLDGGRRDTKIDGWLRRGRDRYPGDGHQPPGNPTSLPVVVDRHPITGTTENRVFRAQADLPDRRILSSRAGANVKVVGKRFGKFAASHRRSGRGRSRRSRRRTGGLAGQPARNPTGLPVVVDREPITLAADYGELSAGVNRANRGIFRPRPRPDIQAGGNRLGHRTGGTRRGGRGCRSDRGTGSRRTCFPGGDQLAKDIEALGAIDLARLDIGAFHKLIPTDNEDHIRINRGRTVPAIDQELPTGPILEGGRVRAAITRGNAIFIPTGVNGRDVERSALCDDRILLKRITGSTATGPGDVEGVHPIHRAAVHTAAVESFGQPDGRPVRIDFVADRLPIGGREAQRILESKDDHRLPVVAQVARMVDTIVDQVVERRDNRRAIPHETGIETIEHCRHVKTSFGGAVEHVVQNWSGGQRLTGTIPAHQESIDSGALRLLDMGGGDTGITRVVFTHRRPVAEHARLRIPGDASGPVAHVERPHLMAGLGDSRLRWNSKSGQ